MAGGFPGTVPWPWNRSWRRWRVAGREHWAAEWESDGQVPPGGRGLAGAGSRVRDQMQPGVRTERVGWCGPCQGSVTPSETGQPSGRNPGPRIWTDASSGPAALSPHCWARFLSIGASVPPSVLGANGSVYSKGSREASMYTVNPVPVLEVPRRCRWRVVGVSSLPSRFCRLWLWLV